MGVRAVKSGNPFYNPANGQFAQRVGFSSFDAKELAAAKSADTYGYAALGRALREASASSAAPAKKSGGRHRMPKDRVGRHRAEPVPFSQKASDFGKERLSDGFDFLYNASSAPIPGLTA